MSTRDDQPPEPGQYPTGLPALDEPLYGGIPCGKLVVLESDSEGQGEELLRLFSLQGPTLFLSTTREACDVESWLEGRKWLVRGDPGSGYTYEQGSGSLPPVETVYVGYEEPLTGTLDGIEFLVDSVNSLESEPNRTYIDFLQRLRRYVQDTKRIVYLHALDEYVDDSGVNHQNRTQTHKLADIVWQLGVETTPQGNVTRITTTKDRTGVCPDEPLQLDIGEHISIDNSRDISL